ncbi:MAG: hypothetical protein HUK07_03200 [Bacteroidaceae bacterium]|nr:hypothetical protein [Bacteroidaceae bacterium]
MITIILWILCGVFALIHNSINADASVRITLQEHYMKVWSSRLSWGCGIMAFILTVF